MVLGLSGEVRGASWEGLGRSWGDLGATLEAVRFRIVFLIDFERQKGAQREAFGEPKWSQNRSQNDSKSKSIFKNEKTLFKTVLGAPWGHLDPIWGPVLGHFLNLAGVLQWFRENQHFRKNDVSRCVLEPLGAIWAPERAQKGGQKGPKRHQKRIQNDSNFLIDFWIDVGPILGNKVF